MIQLTAVNDEIKDELTHFTDMTQRYGQETTQLENSNIQRFIF